MELSTLLPYATAFGLALLHSLWIGALLYTAVRALLPLLTGPRARHHLAYGALCLLGAGFTAAFYLNYEVAPLCENLTAVAVLPFTGTALPLPIELLPPPELSWTEWFQLRLPDFAPWLSLAYLIGLLPAAILLLRDQERVWELRRSGLSDLPATWAERLGDELARHPATRRVKCYLSEQAGEVMTLGFWSPVIVFPVALVNELTPEMARTILLHELAHLRHYDHWLNYPQQMLKTFFFYHPAAHALCQLIDREREHRCDDYVANCCDDRRTYATALVTVARTSHIPPNNLVMSATKTHFSSRIQRLFLGDDRRKDGRFAFSVLLVLLLGAGHLSFTQLGADAGEVDCLGEQKTVVAAPIPLPDPTPKTTDCKPKVPCGETKVNTPVWQNDATQYLSTWNNDAPQPPASDNVRAWAVYEEAVERYEEAHLKVKEQAEIKVVPVITARRQAVRPINSLPLAKVKKPCPQQRLTARVSMDSVPPATTTRKLGKSISLATPGTNKVAFFINEARVAEDQLPTDLNPNDIASVSVVKGESLAAIGLGNYDGAVYITMKGDYPVATLPSDSNVPETKYLTFPEIDNYVFYVNDKRMSLRKVRKIKTDNVASIGRYQGNEQARKFGHENKEGVIKIYLK